MALWPLLALRGSAFLQKAAGFVLTLAFCSSALRGSVGFFLLVVFFFFLNVKIKTRPGGGEASHHNSFLLQCFQSQPNLPLMSAACWARDQELLQNMPAKCK